MDSTKLSIDFLLAFDFLRLRQLASIANLHPDNQTASGPNQITISQYTN
jgi:hypothetical protein